jgi:hypothetical protein
VTIHIFQFARLDGACFKTGSSAIADWTHQAGSTFTCQVSSCRL